MSSILSGPLAEIRVKGKTIGYMKDFRVNENVRRGKVTGLGRLNPREVPAIEWDGEVTCSFYMINLKDSGIPGAEKRVVDNQEQWSAGILFDQIGVDIVCLKQIAGSAVDPVNNIPSVAFEEIATVSGAFIERRNFTVNEGQIAGTDQSFKFINPVTFAK